MAGRVMEDPLEIKVAFQRVSEARRRVKVAFREFREELLVLGFDGERLAVGMNSALAHEWGLGGGEKLSLGLEEGDLKFEGIAEFVAVGKLDELPCALLLPPRSLRRMDDHRLVVFTLDEPVSCTFSTSRNALLDGQVRGLSVDGLELCLSDPTAIARGAIRMGEESMLDISLESDVRIVAPTKVAYLGDTYVGLEFTDKADSKLMDRYKSWLHTQQVDQAARYRDRSERRGEPGRSGGGREFSRAELLVDREPVILVITEREEFARRMGEGLGRKFGFAWLDYLTGPVKPLLSTLGGEGWGPVKLIIVHHQLRRSSPLELTRQMVKQENCELPILLVGSEDDLELKRLRAIEAGAIDFMVVDPFKILAVLRRLDEILRLFA